MRRARQIIRVSRSFEICFIDEIGPLEIRGGGIWPELLRLAIKDNVDDIWVIREHLVPDLLRRLPHASNATICPVHEITSCERLLNKLGHTGNEYF